MAASASKEAFSPSDVFPEPEFFHGMAEVNIEGRSCQERALLVRDLLKNSDGTFQRCDGNPLLGLDFGRSLDPSDPDATCSDNWPRSAGENKFLENVVTYQQYYGRILLRYLPRDHLATNVVLSALQQIAPGSLPQESCVWRRVEERIVNCITRASQIEWNTEHTLFALFPEQEDLEALLIYGSADKGFGHLPEEMDLMLKQAGLYFLVVSPHKRIIPKFWKKHVLRIGWKRGVDYYRIQGGDEPPRLDSDGSASSSGSPRNPLNVSDGKTGTESSEQIYKLTTDLQAARALLPQGLMGNKAEWYKELMQEMDHLINSLTTISQAREATADEEALRRANALFRKRQREGTWPRVSKEEEKTAQSEEALRLANEPPRKRNDTQSRVSKEEEKAAQAEDAVPLANGPPRKRQRNDTQSRVSEEEEKAAQAAEALRLVQAIRVPSDSFLTAMYGHKAWRGAGGQ